MKRKYDDRISSFLVDQPASGRYGLKGIDDRDAKSFGSARDRGHGQLVREAPARNQGSDAPEMNLLGVGIREFC
jgi:hypothetical protein